MIAAQRVPPSAWRTSQSSQSVRSPSALKSHTLRSARPISRWISTVRPSGRPRETPALRPLAGGGGEHRVLRRHPAPALAAQPAWDVLLDRRGAEDDRAPLRVEDRAVRLLEEVGLEVELPKLVGPAAVVTGDRPSQARAYIALMRRPPGVASVTCSTPPIGSWRNRLPISANAAGSPVVRNR